MALTKPILYPISAFDAKTAKVFNFNSLDGLAVKKARLVIKIQRTGQIVYDQTIEIYRFEYAFDPKLATAEMVNNQYYEAVLYTLDINGESSVASNPIQFWCYTTPTLVFTNLNPNDVIDSSSKSFNFEYNQIEGESLTSWLLNVYVEDDTIAGRYNLIFTTGVQYTQSPPGTGTFSGFHVVGGFENNRSYRAILKGQTSEGTEINTGAVDFSVKYAQPGISTPIVLRNDCTNGYIEIRSSIGIIEGEATPEPPVYIGGQEIDLTADGSFVTWSKGLSVIGDFAGVIKCRKLTPYKNIFAFGDGKGNTIKIDWNYGYENADDATTLKCYATLSVEMQDLQKTLTYTIRTDYQNVPDENDKVTIRFGRRKNIYDINLKIEVV